jgi:uncharacterized protein YbjT (DUF2867 family)
MHLLQPFSFLLLNTGATGLVGGAVVARLLLSGHTVHATVRSIKPGPLLEGIKVSV